MIYLKAYLQPSCSMRAAYFDAFKIRITVCIIFVLCLLGCSGKKVKPDEKNIISSSFVTVDSLLLYSTWDNHVIVENINQNKIVFDHLINNTCYARPVINNNTIIFPLSDSILICKNIYDLKTLWTVSLPGRCIDTHVSDSMMVSSLKHAGIIGVNIFTGKVKFILPYVYGSHCLAPDISPYRMSFDNSAFYVCDWQCKNLSAFEIHSGKVIWTKTTNESSGNVTCVNDIIFWGQNNFYKGGRVSLLNSKDGSELFTQSCLFEQNFDPIVYGDKIYYYTYDQKLNEMDLKNKSAKVVFTFSDSNDVSGNQMHLLNNHLYYSAKDNLYKLSLTDFSLTEIMSDIKSIYGVYEKDHKLKVVL